jgi:hypothetical protein
VTVREVQKQEEKHRAFSAEEPEGGKREKEKEKKFLKMARSSP